jgi:hypothetical protein
MLVSAPQATRAIRAGDHVSHFCARAAAGPRNTSVVAAMRLSSAVIVQFRVTVILRAVFQAPMLLECVTKCLSCAAVRIENLVRELCWNILVSYTRARTQIQHLSQTSGALVPHWCSYWPHDPILPQLSSARRSRDKMRHAVWMTTRSRL